MEERTIKLSLKQAREFYQKGGALKELALTAFTEKELTFYTLDNLCKCFNNMYPCAYAVDTIVLKNHKDMRKLEALKILYVIASVLNVCWEKTNDNKGYFIVPPKKQGDKSIYYHSSVTYPGIIYFKSEELAKKAIEILGDKFYDLK